VTAAPTPVSESLVECDGQVGTFQSNFGLCPSYAFGNSNHIGCGVDQDITTGRVAVNVCPQCGLCTPL
jgi:hypothetical protein